MIEVTPQEWGLIKDFPEQIKCFQLAWVRFWAHMKAKGVKGLEVKLAMKKAFVQGWNSNVVLQDNFMVREKNPDAEAPQETESGIITPSKKKLIAPGR